jgi:hypothetical protein
MADNSKKGKRATLEGVSKIIVLGTLALVVVFLVCWRTYDAHAGRGLNDADAEVLMAAFLPVVGATILGYRNFLFRLVQVGDAQNKRPATTIAAGADVVYGAAIIGLLVAVGTVVWISEGGVSDPMARKMATGGAFLWSATIGYIFNQCLRSFLPQGHE